MLRIYPRPLRPQRLKVIISGFKSASGVDGKIIVDTFLLFQLPCVCCGIHPALHRIADHWDEVGYASEPVRSEERRVGKECRSRRPRDDQKKSGKATN